ncbi:MAG: hypothetical protein HUK06_01570 [Bacteroidaceae bacterium]|nr:hypothetical protein [Bacteroidaceae bacterium]
MRLLCLTFIIACLLSCSTTKKATSVVHTTEKDSVAQVIEQSRTVQKTIEETDSTVQSNSETSSINKEEDKTAAEIIFEVISITTDSAGVTHRREERTIKRNSASIYKESSTAERQERSEIIDRQKQMLDSIYEGRLTDIKTHYSDSLNYQDKKDKESVIEDFYEKHIEVPLITSIIILLVVVGSCIYWKYKNKK